MPGTLFVVATPIGNLEDITLRALRVLREVAVVAAEDTRRTGNLLRHYQIRTPLVSLHEHNELHRRDRIIGRLLAGESIALVSDAGTPGISDPGALLVHAARAAGIRVDPIPGPSAITAALSASGLPMEKFAFAGFPPVRSKDRKNWFDWVRSFTAGAIVCFEAPHRVNRTLSELKLVFAERPIIVARELTKAHEEWLYGGNSPQQRGEFVLIIGQSTEQPPETVETNSDPERIQYLFGEMTNTGRYASRRAAAKALAQRLGLSTKTVYDALERAKN